MTRVLHTGDTHLGYQQYHEPERRADFSRAFETVVEDAIEEDVDAVVHAGDLFHDGRPDLEDLQGVVGALRELRAADVPFLAIVGNHEAKRAGQWIDLFADLDLAERLGAEPRIVGDLALYGLDHVPESRRDDLDYEFAAHDAESAALVAHGLFEPFDPGEWDTSELIETATVDFDALLLGDNHDPGTKQVDDTWVTYPGSTERASASERSDRGYNLVSVEDGDLRIARRTIDTREFAFVDVDLAPDEGGDVVRERVREHDHEEAVTIVTIEGDGEPVTPGPVEQLALDRGALVARVNDRREIETEAEELQVSFADPDDAVRERLREMGLSEAAHHLDRVIRDETVADSNVRETARRRVDEHRSEGLAAFEPTDGDGNEGDSPADDSATDDSTTDGGGGDGRPKEEPDEDGADARDAEENGVETGGDDGEATEGVGDAAEDVGEAAENTDGATDDVGDTENATGDSGEDADDAADDADDEDGGVSDAREDASDIEDDSGNADEDGDGQASMEEFV